MQQPFGPGLLGEAGHLELLVQHAGPEGLGPPDRLREDLQPRPSSSNTMSSAVESRPCRPQTVDPPFASSVAKWSGSCARTPRMKSSSLWVRSM